MQIKCYLFCLTSFIFIATASSAQELFPKKNYIMSGFWLVKSLMQG